MTYCVIIKAELVVLGTIIPCRQSLLWAPTYCYASFNCPAALMCASTLEFKEYSAQKHNEMHNFCFKNVIQIIFHFWSFHVVCCTLLQEKQIQSLLPGPDTESSLSRSVAVLIFFLALWVAQCLSISIVAVVIVNLQWEWWNSSISEQKEQVTTNS